MIILNRPQIPIPEDTEQFEEIIDRSLEQLFINARTTLKNGKLYSHPHSEITKHILKRLK